MSEEIIETTVRVDKMTAEWHEGLLKKSKKELRDIVVNTLLEKRLVEDDAKASKQKAEFLRSKLDNAQACIGQSRAMINAIMSKWP